MSAVVPSGLAASAGAVPSGAGWSLSRSPTIRVSALRTALSCSVTARPDSAAIRSISSSVSRCPGSLVTDPAADGADGAVGPDGAGVGEGRTADSWAAAAVEALPITRGVGVPSVAAAVQTSLSAVA